MTKASDKVFAKDTKRHIKARSALLKNQMRNPIPLVIPIVSVSQKCSSKLGRLKTELEQHKQAQNDHAPLFVIVYNQPV